jgi:hypothetical protein
MNWKRRQTAISSCLAENLRVLVTIKERPEHRISQNPRQGDFALVLRADIEKHPPIPALQGESLHR